MTIFSHKGLLITHHYNLVDGGWGVFGNLSECSVSCGIGIAVRKRKCDNPLPKNGGKNCTGEDTQTQTCAIKKCPTGTRCGVAGFWKSRD